MVGCYLFLQRQSSASLLGSLLELVFILPKQEGLDSEIACPLRMNYSTSAITPRLGFLRARLSRCVMSSRPPSTSTRRRFYQRIDFRRNCPSFVDGSTLMTLPMNFFY